MLSLSPHAAEMTGPRDPRNEETSAPALELVRLKKLMERTSGRIEVKIGLIDGSVAEGAALQGAGLEL